LTEPSDPKGSVHGKNARDCEALGTLYIQHLEAFSQGTRVKDPNTGKSEDPDEALLEKVERFVQGPDSELFRSRLINHLMSFRHIGAEFHWHTNPTLEKALRQCVEEANPQRASTTSQGAQKSTGSRRRKPAPYGEGTKAAAPKHPDLSGFQLEASGVYVIRRLRVGVFGEFSAGKSTLINSLVGEEALAVSVAPETNRIEVLAHPGPHYRLRRPIRPKKDLQLREKTEKLFKLGLELWDTPGSNAEDPRHERLADKALEQVDLAIFLIRASDGITRTAQEKFEMLRDALKSRRKEPPVVLLTRFDNLAEDLGDDEDAHEEIEEVLTEARMNLGCLENPWPIDCTKLESFHGPKLLDWLENIVLEHGRRRFLEDLEIDAHPLRHHVALGGDWRPQVIEALQTEEVERFLEEWEAECARAAFKRKRQRRTAYFRYFYKNLAEAWRAARREFGASMSWFTESLKKSPERPSPSSKGR